MDEDTIETIKLISSVEFQTLMKSRKQHWQRTSVVQDDGVGNDQSSVVFQLFDLVQCIASWQLPVDDICSENFNDSANWIRLYGVSREGSSVCVHVYGFMPYIFATVPDDFNSQKCDDLMKHLNQLYFSKFKSNSQAVRSIVPVDLNLDVRAKSVPHNHLIKISIYGQRYVPEVVQLIKEEAEKYLTGFNIEIFEENVKLITRFLADTNLHGCSWIKVPSGKLLQLTFEKQHTTCQIELLVYYKDLICVDCDSNYESLYAPFRMFSFDIECLSKEGRFCKDDEDPVITIANVVRDGLDPSHEKFNVIFALGTTSQVKDAEVFCFRSEIDLLQSWYMFIRLVDPDIFIGHNIIEFDLNYLYTRACVLNITSFSNLGRNVMFSEADEIFMRFNFTGRIVFDSYLIVKKECPRLLCYSLNNISQQLLNDSKEDIDVKLIERLFNGTDMDRRLINSYCLKDALLPLKIFDHINIFQKYVEIVKVSRILLKDLLSENRFNSRLCVISMIKTAHESMLVLKMTKSCNPKANLKLTNLPNIYHKLYRDSLLFASIMIEYNLCYSTIIEKENLQQMSKKMYTKSPCGNFVLKKDAVLGFLPRTLIKLSAQLKTAKNKLRTKKTIAKDKRLVYCRLSAIKIVLNTFPGVLMTGSSQYFFPVIQRNVCAYFDILSEVDRNNLRKKYFE